MWLNCICLNLRLSCFLVDLLDFLTQSSLGREFRKNIIKQIMKTAVQFFSSSNTLSKFQEGSGRAGRVTLCDASRPAQQYSRPRRYGGCPCGGDQIGVHRSSISWILCDFLTRSLWKKWCATRNRIVVPLNFVFLSKYHCIRDLSVAKCVVPNLYLWRATEISCLVRLKAWCGLLNAIKTWQ